MQNRIRSDCWLIARVIGRKVNLTQTTDQILSTEVENEKLTEPFFAQKKRETLKRK